MVNYFPFGELLDRYCICLVKAERIKNYDLNELEWYTQSLHDLGFDFIENADGIESLTSIHRTIWDLEWQLKQGVEDQLSLEEIGRRAIEIRNWNNRRIGIKNIISERHGSQHREVKQDHLSEKSLAASK